MGAPDFLYERSPLLKLSERGGMEPYISVAGLYSLVELAPYLRLSFIELPCLGIAQRSKPHPLPIGCNAHGIEWLLHGLTQCLGEESSQLFYRRKSHFYGVGIVSIARLILAFTSSLGISSVMSNI